MNGTPAESRAKRLAKELKELWEKPTTTETLRPSFDAEVPQKQVAKKIQPAKRR